MYLPYLSAMRAAFRESLNSNDPDTKVGAICVLEREDRFRYVGRGSNVILLDFDTNEEKLLASAHAEKMAIAAAREAGFGNLSKLTLVVTRMPCAGCMTDIWLSGCKRVVYMDRDIDRPDSKWAASFVASRKIAAKYHIDLIKMPREALLSHETVDSQDSVVSHSAPWPDERPKTREGNVEGSEPLLG